MNAIKTTLVSLLAAGSVFALPVLQLDMSGGSYDTPTETVVNTSDQFDLIALLNADDYSGNYYISMAVTPQISVETDIGSFVFGDSIINISKMQYGTPPVDSYIGKKDAGLASHSIFPTYYYEYEFTFDASLKALDYNVQDDPGSLSTDPIGKLFYQSFAIDLSNLSPMYGIHFDLYNKTPSNRNPADLDVDDFAPFSHDAEARKVPEPATLSLFGMGLLILGGMGLIRRRK